MARRHTKRITWLGIHLTSAFVAAALFVPSAVAAAGNQAATAAISQSYQTQTTGIAQGTLLTSSRSAMVAPAGGARGATNLVGVAASKPLLELSDDGSSSVQVVVSGTALALVSNANGPIKVGDRITTSPISGIGMKATGSSEVVGTSQADLSSVKTVSKRFAGSNGQGQTALVGLLPIAVNVAYYSAVSAQGNVVAYIPPFLQNIADSVAGKAVSPLRVLIASTALLLGFVTIVTMLYVGIRSGVISLGRNPLAADALRRGMIDIMVTAVGILVVTGVVVAGVIAA